MRNTKKWLVFLLCAVMLVSNLGITAMATENPAPLELDFFPGDDRGSLIVDILATESQIVADGKLVVTYDPDAVTYEGTEISTAWSDADKVTLSDNAKDGKVILAFASAEAAADGILFRLRFSGAVGHTQIGLTGSDSYISGTGSVPTMGGEYCPSDRFVDMKGMLPEIHEAVDYMTAMYYMNGMSKTMFGPNVELNRAMMVTILYRIAGEPEVSGTSAFVDVPNGEFYTDPVIWATGNGITNGLDSRHFAPGKSLSRQELVTFLYRFAGVMGYDRTATTDLSAYTDADKVQPYAVQAFQWAVASGVVNGTSETTLSPEAFTTRAQICIMVRRLLVQQD